MVELFANSGDSDQMLHSVASDLRLHCLPVACLRVSSLQWVKVVVHIIIIIDVMFIYSSNQLTKFSIQMDFF